MMRCPKCGHYDVPHLSWVKMHLGAYCAKCRWWLKWISQSDPLAQQAPAKPQHKSLFPKDESQ